MTGPNEHQVRWILALTIAGIYTLLAINLTVSFSAQKAAHEAQRAAERARPNPYTRLDGERDKKGHVIAHARVFDQLIDRIDTGDDLTKAELRLIIGELEIPPAEVKVELEKLRDRTSALESRCASATMLLQNLSDRTDEKLNDIKNAIEGRDD